MGIGKDVVGSDNYQAGTAIPIFSSMKLSFLNKVNFEV
jgi:hypothetical protein